MVVLHAGDAQLVAYDVQRTSPAIHIQKESGEIYYVSLVPVDGDIVDMSETLVYEENTINTCQSVNLSAGFYRVEMRGGAGGKPYACDAGTGKKNIIGDIVSSVFKLNNDTVVYSLRGGDGVSGAPITQHQIPGGPSSGVDSMLVLGNRTIRAIGGSGSRCYSWAFAGYPAGGYGVGKNCGGGAGGVYPVIDINVGGDASVASSYAACAGGGGGANDSGGGTGGTMASSANFVVGAAIDAQNAGGGNGGNIENLVADSQTKNIANGGVGGKNVYFSCGGQVAVSYGGGGGGATCALSIPSDCSSSGTWCVSDCADGGDGGSGSTGTSDTSFLRIYKIG